MKNTQETSSTSTIDTPKIKSALLDKYEDESAKLPKKTKGGIYYSDEQIERQQLATVCGNVLEMGPDCYRDKERYPDGPWCKKGDWVIFARYAGSRFKIEGGEVRLLNDDEIIATIKNPEDIIHEF